MPTTTKTSAPSSSFKYVVFVFIGILIAAALILLVNQTNVLTGNVVREGVQPTSARALIDDDPILGNPRASVTIVQYTDAQCPYCRRFESTTFKQIKETYIDTGRVAFVTRDFPLESIHPAALPAAMAGECVQEVAGDSAYYAYKELLVEKQNERDSGRADGPVTQTVSFTGDDLVSWAQELGYHIQSCLESERYLSEVRKDLADGQAAGVRGTPAFFIIDASGESTMLSGAQPYDVMKRELDRALDA